MRSVFFVDDEPLITKGLHAILDWERYGLQIAGTAADGRSALEQLRQRPVDLLITDIQMPGMNGLELIQRVKASSPRTKFIVLSGYEEFHYVKEGMQLGIENYILKPINIVELESTLKLCLQDWEREEINQFRSEVDWKLLQSNVLQRWVHGEIEQSEFVQRAQLLGIPQSYVHYRAAVFRLLPGRRPLQSLCQVDRLAEAVEGELTERLGSDAAFVCFTDLAEDIVVLLEAERLTESGLETLLASIAQRLHELSELPVWVSLGASWAQTGSIQSSYDSAIKHYEQLLMGASRQVAVALPAAGGQAAAGATDMPTVLPDVEGFTMKLIDGNAAQIERHILEVLDAPPEQALLERQPYVNAAIALMLAIKEMAGGEDYSELFMPIPQLATLDELRQHVLAQARSLRERQDRARQGQAGQTYSPHVAFLLEQVERHYAEDMSLKTLSQTLDIHPTYLGQLFHQELGTSFSDYVNHYRIEKATQLLLRTELKTSDIAREVGYLDSSYFYRQFKKYAGLSPTELRSMSSRA